MQLYLIRHCQSENNALWKRTGSGNGRSADPPLTELGHQQANCLRSHFNRSLDEENNQDGNIDQNGIQLTHIYCSLMRRSIETGLYISKQLDLPLVARGDLHERGGIYLRDPDTQLRNGLAGPNREYFRRNFPSLVLPDDLGDDGWWNRPYENSEMAFLRAQSMMEWLLATHDNSEDKVGLVIHGGFIQSIFSVILHLPLDEPIYGNGRDLWIKGNNGSITRFDFLEKTVRLSYQNRVDFIPADLVS